MRKNRTFGKDKTQSFWKFQNLFTSPLIATKKNVHFFVIWKPNWLKSLRFLSYVISQR